VLLAIADYLNDDKPRDPAWPSVAALARKTALKERAVRAAITELKALGELVVEENAGPGGVNLYRVITKTPAKNAGVQKMQGAENAPLQDSPGVASSQVNGHTPAESAPPAFTAPLQDAQGPPAESAPVTVNEPPKNSPSESSARAKAAKRGTRIPDDFAVTAEMVAWARQRCPNVNGKHETEKFTNYWQAKAGQAATKLDWPATWRNWMLSAEERAAPPASTNGHSGGSAISPRDEHRFRK
jgi:hypothetical protein